MNACIAEAKIEMLASLRDYSIDACDFEPILTLGSLSRGIDETICNALFDCECDYHNVIEFVSNSDDFGIVSILGVSYQLIASTYRESLNQGIDYKEAYKLAKARIEEYAAIVGKSPIYLLEQKP